MKARRWTKEEEELIVKAMQNNPGNYTKAFRETAEQIGRTYRAVQYHWYGKMSPASNPTKSGILVTLLTPTYKYDNRKNSGTAISQPQKSTLWTKIKKFIGLK